MSCDECGPTIPLISPSCCVPSCFGDACTGATFLIYVHTIKCGGYTAKSLRSRCPLHALILISRDPRQQQRGQVRWDSAQSEGGGMSLLEEAVDTR